MGSQRVITWDEVGCLGRAGSFCEEGMRVLRMNSVNNELHKVISVDNVWTFLSQVKAQAKLETLSFTVSIKSSHFLSPAFSFTASLVPLKGVLSIGESLGLCHQSVITWMLL